MKWCPKCKKNLSDKNNYCSKCGSKLQDDPLYMGSIFTKEDEDFAEYRRGFT
jgi:predicted amidophosphoribosyltransferase